MLLTSCGGSDESAPTTPSGILAVNVEPQRASPGEELQATVFNLTDKPYTYGAAYELETRIDGRWQKVKLPPYPIIEIAYVAQPGEEGPPVSFKIPKDAAPGAWRVVISRDAPEVGLLSGEFRVVGG